MSTLSSREHIIWYIIGIFGLVLFLAYQPLVTPLSKVEVTIGRSEATAIAEEYLDSHGFDLTELDSLYKSVMFLPSQVQERSYQILKFSDKDYQFLEERSPAYYWQVSWFDGTGRQIYQAVVSPDGVPFGFNHYIPEDVPGDSLTQEQAKQIMDTFLETKMNINLENYELLEVSSDKQKSRMDYFLNYYSKYDFPGEIQLHLRTTIRGDRPDHVTTYFHMPERIQNEAVEELQNQGIISFAVVPVIMVIIFLVLSILYILRFHAGEIAVKAPIVVGILYAIIIAVIALNSFDVWAIMGPGNTNPAMRMIGYLVIYILAGVLGAVMILLAWSVGDSIVREKWGYKLILFDKISAGRILFPSLLPSVVIGYMTGLFAVGLWSVLTYILTQNFSVWTESRTGIFLFTSYVPALEVVGEAITDTLFYSFIGGLFMIAFFKKHIQFVKNRLLNTFIALLLMAVLVSFSQSLIPVYPIHWRYIITVVTSFFLGWVFVKYDLVAVLVAGFILSIVPYAYELTNTDYGYFYTSGIISYAFAFVPLAVGLIAYWKGKELTPEEIETKPSYVKLITERERMAHELDIAREMQMKLLPKEIPQVDGFDIYGFSVPAKEVGGDYFDFIDIGNEKLGIIVGDVSGKGTSAALVMAAARTAMRFATMQDYPTNEALNFANKRLFEDIDKNTFIAIFYGILDGGEKNLFYTNAGQTISLIYRADEKKCYFLQQEEIGERFPLGIYKESIYYEQKVPLNKGDYIIFYSDGIVEAMNTAGELYGFERFMQSISEGSGLSAAEMSKKIVRDLDNFVGKAEQHDDITMVVVWVK